MAGLRELLGRLRRRRRGLRSFEEALRAAGGVGSARDRGIVEVPTGKIIGSVSRWQSLRSDFFYKTGKSFTQRFYRVGQAMQAGKALPPVELYKLQPQSVNFDVDGHHRVAMARRFGQDFMDAHVVEYVGNEAQLAHALRRVALFRDASADDLVALWRHLSEVRVPAGAVICTRGEPGDRFYIIQAGSVEVRLGVSPVGLGLYRLAPGNHFGEMALLIGATRSADVVALEDTVLWALERSDFDRVMDESVSLPRALNRSLAQRLAMATNVIEQAEQAGSRTDPAGMRFGPYRVLAQLGEGGMAVVYSAVREDGTVIALKVLPAGWGQAPELRARLEREAATLQRIDHPGVIQVLDVGAVAAALGGGTYIAMEWLPDALDRVLQAQFPEPLPLASALRIARDVAVALGAVHAAQLVHRDVKPSNILLRANGQPVVSDFGLVAAITDFDFEGRGRLTPANLVLGTADYLAPEAITGQPVDGRVDLYALGVMLYEMLAGFVPFAGRDPLQTLRAHCEEAVPPLASAVPPEVRAIVERALEKQPRDRFASADEMAAALDSALQQVVGLGQPNG
jgi:hypothetical protein